MYNQFRPPLFPNNYGNIGTGSNFNNPYSTKPGMYQLPFGSMQSFGPNASPMPNPGQGMQNLDGYALQENLGQSGAVSPSNNTMLDDSSVRSSSRRIQQVQHHVQQVPVYRTIQVQERYIEIPQIHIVKEYVPKIEVVERIREVPKIEIQVVEKIVDVPQIQYVDKYVDKIEVREVIKHVPKIEIVEVTREVPKIEYQIVERIVEVPQIQYVDKVVEVTQIKEVIKHVPKVEIIEVPVRREVRVPKIEIRQVEEVKEVLVPELIEVPIEKEVRVNVNVPRIQRVERPVPGPINIVDVEVEVKVPKPVQVPHYIDIPVPHEVIKEIPVPRQVVRYRDVQVEVEVEHIVVERVERRVPVPRTVYKHVEEIKRIEVPYEVTVPQEVEEIVEIVNQIQPVIEPIVHTRYEKLPPIREQGKAVYMNGQPSSVQPSSVQPSSMLQPTSMQPSSMQPSSLPQPPSMPQPSSMPAKSNMRFLPPIGPPSSFGTLATPVLATAFNPLVPNHPFQQLAFSNSQLSVPLAATAINLPAVEKVVEAVAESAIESVPYPIEEKAEEMSREETCEIAPIFAESDESNLADKTIAGEDAPNEPLASWDPLVR